MKKSPSYPLGGSSSLSEMVAQTTRRHHSDSEPESDDHVAVPEFRTSMSDAISKALENLVIDEKDEGAKTQQKKKKNKGKVLFATGMGSFN